MSDKTLLRARNPNGGTPTLTDWGVDSAYRPYGLHVGRKAGGRVSRYHRSGHRQVVEVQRHRNRTGEF